MMDYEKLSKKISVAARCGLFFLASALWSTASVLVRKAVQLGILKPARLGPRVVSVGNIQAGGAGKTPLVALIAQEAHERDLRVAILCRGYGGAWENAGGVIRPEDPPVSASLCGDEAALLHDLAPAAWIGVGADRVAQFEALKTLGTSDLVILDDGFQHWKIQKDIEVVAVTSLRPTQVPFRDWPHSLKNAGLLVWTKGGVRPQGGTVASERQVKVHYRLKPAETKAPVWLVTGVADAQHVMASALAAGYVVAHHYSLADHVQYTSALLERIQQGASQAGCGIILTGKDWVKWRELGVDRRAVQVLEPEIVFEEGRENWLRVLWG